MEITPAVVKGYQTSRLAEKAGPKTIDNEVLLLLRLCGDQGDPIRARLRRLAESGAGDEVIMSIAGLSRAMLSRYSHVRMEAKRRALDEIAARQRAADEKRQQEVERRQPAAVVPPSAVVH